jgi:serine/threonine protein kinase
MDQEKVHREAIIMERMTASRNILDIYSHCGTSVLVESMASDIYTIAVPGEGIVPQVKLDDMDGVQSLNNFTASEKLQISLLMAESLRDLHEFDGGIIVHGDTHLEQWLIGHDGSVKLNDFNNAYTLKWNAVKQAYCPVVKWYDGTYRSPEEFNGQESDESKDTYAFGNVIYNLLTGLWPYYDEYSRGVSEGNIQKSIVAGKRPFVDERYNSRSFIEGELVRIMVLCWQHSRWNRPAMAQVVSFLLDVKSKAIDKGELIPSQLIHIPIEL